MKTQTRTIKPFRRAAALALTAVLSAPSVFAASQIWTNAPVSTSWTNVNNWVGKAAPGDVNVTTANTVNGDLVTFNAPLFGGIGGAGNPIVPDDATVVNGRSRRIMGITFDATNCGPYVISSPSAPVITDGSSTLTTGYLYVSHNTATNAAGEPLGAIRINASVTNSQAVLVPMLVNLPSSTAGQYWLVNNSTNPGVQLIVGSITHAGATTRATVFNLDGTNTAPNIVTNLSEGGGNGTGGIQKNGPNTWVVAGPGVFNRVSPNDSTISVNNGTLVAQDPASFGTTLTTVINVFTNATLRVDGVTLTPNVINLLGGRLLVNGNATVNGVTVQNVVNAFGIVATSNATDVVTFGTAVNRIAGASTTSTLRFVGPGTVLMPNANSFAGKFSLEAGTNQLSDAGALGVLATYTLARGAVLDLTPLGAGGYSFTAKSLTANGTNTSSAGSSTIVADAAATVNMQSRAINLSFSPTSFAGDTGHPALHLAQGTFSFNGNSITVSNASGTALGAGTYQIVSQASGTIASSGAFVTTVTGAGLAAGTVGEIVASGNSLNLLVTVYTPKTLVWSGGDVNNPNNWDRQNSINWLNGASPTTFNIYDQVTFNATGSAYPTVTLTNTMVPGYVTVDTTANDYTVSGAGQVAGGTGLTKKGSGTLFLNTANSYSGGSFITNGTVKIGVDNALPSTGYGDVTNNSPATIDLNGFSDSIGALNGSGAVDVTGGGSSTLAVGANDNSGTFSGVINNTAGTLTLLKSGLGSQTLTASNSFSGGVIIDQGTLRASNTFALGNSANGVIITNGTLDVATNIIIAALNGAGGSVANATTTTITNTVTITNGGTFGGVVAGRLGVIVAGGTLRYNAANAYTNPTWVATGAGLAFGNVGNVSSPVILSNTATVNMPTANNPSANVNANFTVVDNATATFSSANTANNYSGQFNGSSLATAVFSGGIMSIGGAYSFSNFLGTVTITNGTVRMFNAVGGGDNTTFNFVGTGGMFSRDANFIRLGALFGNGRIDNPSVTFGATYAIGAKNVDSSFQGTISGSNNIVKTGTGRLTLDGNGAAVVATDSATFTNYSYASVLSYLNNTTVSNGVLAISVPNDLTYSPNIILAATNAILDALNMGYVSNFTDVNGANAALVTNGTLTIASTTPNSTPQVLGGIGFVKSLGVTNNGTINPGLTGFGGALTISNGLAVNAGATNFFDLSDDLTGLIRSSDQLKVVGNVSLTGSSFIGVGALNGNLKAGTYPVIKYTGSLLDGGGVVPTGIVPNVTVGGAMTIFSRASFVASNAPGEIDLIVSSLNSSNVTWLGDGISNVWEVAGNFAFTNNAGSQQFYQMDNVTFDNTSSPSNNTVTLLGSVAPLSLVVNSTTNFAFGGSGNIQGSVTLLKIGTGALTLTNGANLYSGGTVISNGLLSVGADSGNNQNDFALGSGAVTVSGGELRFGGNNGAVVTHAISNSIVLNGGTVKAQDGVQRFTNSTVNVAAGGGTLTTVFATKNLILDSPLIGAGNVTIAAVPAGTNVAGGQVILNNATNTFSGTVSIATNANLALVGAAGLSNSAAIDVQLAGILDVTGRTNVPATLTLLTGQTLKGNGVVRGNIVMNSGSTLAPGVTGAIGTLNISNAATTVTLNGTVSMDISRPSSSDRLVSTTNVFAGTITVNNIGATLQAGDTFTLFTSTTNRGVFAVTNLPSLSAGLGWSNSLAQNGKITVVSLGTDLALTKSAPATVLPASSFSYTITVTNQGGNLASTVVVTDAIPAGLTFASASGGGVNNGGVVSWALGTMNSLQTSNLTLTVTAPLFGSFTNRAVVSSATTDTAPNNNTNTAVVTTIVPSSVRPFITNTVSGSTLTLQWPVVNTGYRLQVQTNTLATGLNTATNAWFTVPGSTNVNSIVIPLNPANPSVFYQLIY